MLEVSWAFIRKMPCEWGHHANVCQMFAETLAETLAEMFRQTDKRSKDFNHRELALHKNRFSIPIPSNDPHDSFLWYEKCLCKFKRENWNWAEDGTWTHFPTIWWRDGTKSLLSSDHERSPAFLTFPWSCLGFELCFIWMPMLGGVILQSFSPSCCYATH